MDHVPLKHSVFKAKMKDSEISFNVNRNVMLDPESRRQIVLLPKPFQKSVIPGCKKAEKKLLIELRSYQNWTTVKRFSFQVDQYDHSFAWRFRLGGSAKIENLEDLSLLSEKKSKEILKQDKTYQSFLKEHLQDGGVFMMPDREISFGCVSRVHHGYSRPVLILKQDAGLLLMIPFSTKGIISHPKLDIILDPSGQGVSDLSTSAQPAVERWPYKIFSSKTVLCVNAMQPIHENVFLQIALQPRGSVRKELVKTVRERLKKTSIERLY